MDWDSASDSNCLPVYEFSAVGEISDCKPGGPRFNPRPGQGLNFGQSSFATPSMVGIPLQIVVACLCAMLAQLVRYLTANWEIPSSIPGLFEG